MPVIILFKGHPGTGKSSTAKYLARTLKWPIIDKDDSKDTISNVSGISDEDANRLAYRIMLQHVETQLSVGISLIVDSLLSSDQHFKAIQEKTALKDYEAVIVELLCSDQKAWMHRLEERARVTDKSHKPNGEEEMQKILGRYKGSERWTEKLPSSQKYLQIDTCKVDSKQAAEQILELIKSLKSTPLKADDEIFLNSG